MADSQDYDYMARALRSPPGFYTTDPNPGSAVSLVRDAPIVGEGWHQRAGEPHAEVLALAAAIARAVHRLCHPGAVLSPRAHAPCARPDRRRDSPGGGAMQDPNPLVAGKGRRDWQPQASRRSGSWSTKRGN